MRSVMIVDDYSVFRKRIAHFPLWKNQSEFSINLEAENGKQALELAARHSVDLILTDIKMPIMDGLALLREVKAKNLCPCVVLLSEYSDFLYAREGLVLGAFDYLVKPVDAINLSRLLERVADFLSHRERENSYHNEISMLSDSLTHLAPQTPSLARQVLEHIYQQSGGNLVSTGIAASKIVDQIHQRIFCRFPWMRHYTNVRTSSEQEITFETWQDLRFSFEQIFRDLLSLLRLLYPPTEDLIIRKSIAQILENPESDLRLNTVAELLFVNKSYLSTRFKKMTGIPFITYVNLVRIERGKYLLGSSPLNITEVAERLGYHDSEYFGQLFKRMTGMRPSSYRSGRFLETSENSQEISKDFG